MENFGKRTTVSLFVAFLIVVVGFVAMLDGMSKAVSPSAHCDSHLHFVAASKS
jgi:hypothetical protein